LTFWPPGPEARAAWTWSACSGTRTDSVTTIAAAMRRLYRDLTRDASPRDDVPTEVVT